MSESNDIRVSSQWFSRPADQRFTTLSSLLAATLHSAQNSEVAVVDTKDIRMQAHQADADNLVVQLPGQADAKLSHWSFGQLCGLVNAPASYLRHLPAPLAAINLQYGLQSDRRELVKSYATQNGDRYLRALTGPDYGRIYDHEVVAAVQKIAGEGGPGDPWRVPGIVGKALTEVTKKNTTLYASDRDVFIFLADESTPIEIGHMDDGSPDIVYRGFYTWNSEVGSRSFGLKTFLFRYVCQNRIIWGQSNVAEFTMRHSKLAPQRFVEQAAPALLEFSRSSTLPLINGIRAAKEKVVARTEDDRLAFLQARGFSQAQATKVMDAVVLEEGHAPASVWDFVQGITAVARDLPNQDSRVNLEEKAGKLMRLAA